ncbi:hypothetical protein TVAG_100100 [Trichomonas vaginalis G3]|uniref:Uncharacterized protein n=1 Tax=Trichomonas vaginalis (strain ATCC PRA-98 / G3) TaxID=412133 RepID=A2EK76_TRIV3|nr:galactose-binding domain-like family [Trichomonas vaginalis G3]EAY06969.1 hypothetical protein TVAG_100100 [Trichomonas vaginalis G3]KAI5499118.1 galactose-binding domain-like family [Trichomonas vaginalis G3]|eukprot:XP_001319192.1 hypothetical protein [Trichomonas vaginalis G3]
MSKFSIKELLTVAPSKFEDGLVQTILKSNDLFNNDYFSLEASKESKLKCLLEYAFDKDTKTYYFTEDKDPHLEFIFKGVFNLSGLVIHCIYNPYIKDFDVVGSKDGRQYNLIYSYRSISDELYGNRKLFECNQSEFYKRIRINFLRDSLKQITGSMFELDIFGAFLRVAIPSCILQNELSLGYVSHIISFILIIT